MGKENGTIAIRIDKKVLKSIKEMESIDPRVRATIHRYDYGSSGNRFNYRIPIDVLSNNDELKKYLSDKIEFTDGEYYAYGYQGNRNGLTSKLFSFKIKSENVVAFKTYKRFSYYWFRRQRK